jgi:hypothetical protein
VLIHVDFSGTTCAGSNDSAFSKKYEKPLLYPVLSTQTTVYASFTSIVLTSECTVVLESIACCVDSIALNNSLD